MQTPCGADEISHLWLPGGEHWVLPPGLAINYKEISGGSFYPDLWYWRANFLCYSCVNRFVGWESSWVQEGYWHTFNEVFQLPSMSAGLMRDASGQLVSGHPSNWVFTIQNGYPVLDNFYSDRCPGIPEQPQFLELIVPPARGWRGGGGHDENPIDLPSRYELWVGDQKIKESLTAIYFSVKCGDDGFCPPGYSASGGTCEWENKDPDGNPKPNGTDNDPKTPKTCPYGYWRFFDRCLRIPGWDYRDPNNPKPPDNFLPPFGDDRRPPDPEGNCPPGYEKFKPPRGRVQCRKKCPKGEVRDPKTGQCCCAGIPAVEGSIRALKQEVRGIRRELL